MKKEKNKLTAAKVWTGSIIAALVAAVAVFVAMLQLEKNMLSQYEKGVIYVAQKNIPKGQFITDENWEEYVEIKELDKTCIPQTAITNESQLENLIAVFEIDEGVLLTDGMFTEQKEVLKNMAEPVTAGFKAEELYQVIGGTLRTGDRIHIYQVNDEGETFPVWLNVFVQQAFDSSGMLIANDDKTTPAQMLNVYLDKKDVEAFYTELAKGTLRVVKVSE